MSFSRRNFLKITGAVTGNSLIAPIASRPTTARQTNPAAQSESRADYTIRIAASPVEIAPNRILSTTTYNETFPGPLLRFKQGQPVTVDIQNDTDTPEQLHWHGQMVPVEVDGAAEEGTPFIPAHGKRRITFTPKPAGLRFYHSHNRAGANLSAASTAARSVRFTSSRKRTRETTTARYSWSSRSSNRRSAEAATWRRISSHPPPK